MARGRRESCTIGVVVLVAHHAGALDNGLGTRPPMGYNKWNDLGPDLNSAVLRSRVDAMITSGLRDAGYTYFNLDDGWANDTRTPDGRLLADPVKLCSLPLDQPCIWSLTPACSFRHPTEPSPRAA